MRMESSDSSFGRCNTPSLATYSAAALAKAERKMNHWEQQALGQLHDAVSSQNLQPERWAHVPANVRSNYRVIKYQLQNLSDVGCGTRPNWAGKDLLSTRQNNRHSFNLWQRTMPCIGNRQRVQMLQKRMRADVRVDAPRSLCAWDAYRHRDDCTVYSLGSNGDIAFERAVINSTTSCIVHTFDCTMQGMRWQTERRLGERLWFHPWCISARDGDPDQRYMTLSTVQRRLGHKKLSLLKVDIEGFEHNLFSSWRAEDRWLPEQLTAELHCTTELLSGRYRFMSVGEQTALLHHFHLLGYRLATLEWEGGGIDVTFIRAVCPTF
jgi:hypothetical protein